MYLITYLLRIHVITVDVKSQVNEVAFGIRSVAKNSRSFPSRSATGKYTPERKSLSFDVNSILFNQEDDLRLT